MEVITMDGGLIYISAYEYRGDTSKYRVLPVKVSPYP
jgi:hypothetical protein